MVPNSVTALPNFVMAGLVPAIATRTTFAKDALPISNYHTGMAACLK